MSQDSRITHPSPRATGAPAGPGIVTVTAADITAQENDGIISGTITSAGDFLQIPINAGGATQGINSAARLLIGLPAGLLDGSGSALLVFLEWGAAPTGTVQTFLALRHATSLTAIGAGIGSNGGNQFAVCANTANFNAQGTNTPEFTATGLIVAPGNWDAVNTVSTAATSGCGSTDGIRSEIAGTTGTYDAADMQLCIAINARSAMTETLSLKVRFQVV